MNPHAQLDLNAVRSRLHDRHAGDDLQFVAEVDSTNRLAAQLPPGSWRNGTTVFTDFQTAGRGRRGRAWHAPRGSAVLASTLLKPCRLRIRPRTPCWRPLRWWTPSKGPQASRQALVERRARAGDKGRRHSGRTRGRRQGPTRCHRDGHQCAHERRGPATWDPGHKSRARSPRQGGTRGGGSGPPRCARNVVWCSHPRARQAVVGLENPPDYARREARHSRGYDKCGQGLRSRSSETADSSSSTKAGVSAWSMRPMCRCAHRDGLQSPMGDVQ